MSSSPGCLAFARRFDATEGGVKRRGYLSVARGPTFFHRFMVFYSPSHAATDGPALQTAVERATITSLGAPRAL